jgi:iron(III) transport system substrate-binding protein
VGEQDHWVGFAQRARVCVYNTERVDEANAPRTLHDLLDPRFTGRIVIARPAFGSTRGHMAAMLAMWGETEMRAWIPEVSYQIGNA